MIYNQSPDLINKLPWEDRVKLYGDHLLKKLQESHPTIPMIGYLPIFSYGDYLDIRDYHIKKGAGIIARFNPLSKRLVTISGDSRADTIRVHEKSLLNDVEKIVKELNLESELCFRIS